MKNRIIFTNPETGTASIVVMAPGFEGKIAEEAQKLGLEPGDCEFVTDKEIPSDRSHREAWIHDTTDSPNKIGVRVGLARDISLARVRANRDEQLAEVDKEYVIAQRNGVSDTADLDAKRQKLLDATEALKALDLNDDGIISVEEAVDQLLPLELVGV